MRNYLLYAIAAISLSGCFDNSQAPEAKAEVYTPAAAKKTSQFEAAKSNDDTPSADGGSLCPDDGPTLPNTGICEGRAVNYLNMMGGDAPQIPANCHWSVNETAMIGDYLLYLAATCNGKKAKLEFAGGAHFAELSLGWSAVANEALEDTVLIKVGSAEPGRPDDNILFYAKDMMDDPVEAEKCAVRQAGIDGWPSDALVIDVSAEEAAKAPSDEPRAACGMFGLDQESTAYWRVFQGFSWWFQFSQDAYQDIDPRSLTLVTPDKSGGWMTLE